MNISSHGYLSLVEFLFLLSLEDLLGWELMLVDVTIFFLLPWICDGAACASTMALAGGRSGAAPAPALSPSPGAGSAGCWWWR